MNQKVALVTGASSGIGAATAQKLSNEGYIVYGAARRIERIAGLTNVKPIQMDITKDDQVVAAVKQIIQEQGRIDVLVNNAGFAQFGPVEEVSIEAARYQFEVNIFGLSRLTQLVLPHMRAEGFGKIVNISSMGGRIYTPLGAWYHATKHALEGWSDCLRIEVKPMGIDVIIIEPGGISTEFNDVLGKHTVDLALTDISSPYQELANKVERILEDPDFVGKASPPSLIADTIYKALTARKPKFRYMAGYLAKPMWALRRFGGDKLYDRAVEGLLK